MRRRWFLLTGLLCSLQLPLAGLATQSDVAKERRWAEQVVESLLDGDAVWLRDADDHEFLGILTPGESASRQAVILVHGIGAHPNWPEVIFPLREGLLEAGTTSLSIQMPILSNQASSSAYAQLLPEVAGRFRAAQRFLAESGYTHIAIVAHSMGATMAAYYLSTAAASGVSALVVIGIGSGVDGAIDNAEAMGRIKLDILDLYGSSDLDQVLDGVSARTAAAANRAGYAYDRVMVEGADHFFRGQESALTRQVVDWLEATPKPGQN